MKYWSLLFEMRHLFSLSGVAAIEPLHEKTRFLPAKTKVQISCAVIAQLISAFVFAYTDSTSTIPLLPKFEISSF